MRRAAAFRGWADIESGPGRYHLYVAPACPWSHRTMIVRRLKGLDDASEENLAALRREAERLIAERGADIDRACAILTRA